MSTLAVAATTFDPVGEEPTLDELLVGAWEGLAARRSVECPVCCGEMKPVGRKPGDGRCTSCGSALQ